MFQKKNKKPFLHFEIENFLEEEFAVNLLKALAKEKYFRKESDLFSFWQTNDLITSKNKIIQKFRSLLLAKDFITQLEKATKIKIKKNTIDLSSSLYQNTDHLLCHDDQLENRKIAFIFYLTTLKKGEGGSLILHGKKTKKIVPKFNKIVLFQVSKKSLHEVEEVLVDKQRISIGGWFHGN